MFFHIGGEILVPKRDLVAIIDLNKNGSSKVTKEFLEVAASEGNIVETKDKEGKYKSCIITINKIYLSSISATTLNKRIQNMSF